VTRRRRLRVALDGPAGVGKTTTARALARELDLVYVDTGAMYRALAVAAAEAGVSVDDPVAAARLAREVRIDMEPLDGDLRVLLDGRNVTEAVRSAAATDGASRISVHAPVRRELVRLQRRIAARGGVVMEGRDIGTVVLADAEAKVFLTASAEERARRRHRELAAGGGNASLEAVLREIRERDARDQGRSASPLRPASDAVVIDCTALDAPSQVAAVRRVVEALARLRAGAVEP
jgi:cytidylate kinase